MADDPQFGLTQEQLAAVTGAAGAADHVQKAQQLQGSLVIAQQHSPDEAAKAQSFGVMDPEFYKAAQSQGFQPMHPPVDQMVKETPKTAAFLSVPANAAVSHDDVGSLQGLERMAKQHQEDQDQTQWAIAMHSDNPGVALQQMMLDKTTAGRLGSAAIGSVGSLVSQLTKLPSMTITGEEAILMASGFPANLISPKWDKTLRENFNWTALGDPGKALQDYAKNSFLTQDQEKGVADIKAAWNAGDKTLALRKIGESTAALAPLLLHPLVFGAAILGTGAEASEQARENGAGPEMATLSGLGHAGAFELAGKLSELGPVKWLQELTGKLSDTIPPEVADQAIKSSLNQALKNLGVKFYHGAFAGAALTSANALTDVATGGNPDAFKDFGTRLLDDSLSWGLMTAGGSLFHEKAAEVQEAAGAKQTILGMKALVDASPVTERAPETMIRHLQGLNDGTSLEKRHISTDDFDAIAEKHGVEPLAMATDMGHAEAYAKAKEAKTDLQIPTADLLVRLKDHPAQADFIDKSRSTPDGISPEQAKAEAKEQLSKAQAEKAAFDESAEKVKQARINQMLDAGIPPNQAEKEATLFQKFVARMTPELRRNPGFENATPEDFVKWARLDELTPKQLSMLERAKQIFTGKSHAGEGEETDANGLTESERDRLDKAMRAEANRATDKRQTVTNWLIKNGKLLESAVDMGELKDMEKSTAVHKKGVWKPDLALEEMQRQGVMPPDSTLSDMYEAMRQDRFNRMFKGGRVHRQEPEQGLPEGPYAENKSVANSAETGNILERQRARLSVDRARITLRKIEDRITDPSHQYSEEGIAFLRKLIEAPKDETKDAIEVDGELVRIYTGEGHEDNQNGQPGVVGADRPNRDGEGQTNEGVAQPKRAKANEPTGRAPARERTPDQIAAENAAIDKANAESAAEYRAIQAELQFRLDRLREHGQRPFNGERFEQGGESKEARGQLLIPEHGQGEAFVATMTRFANSDLSTGIHEMGHYMLESMRGLAALPNASEMLKEDLGKLGEFAGVKDGEWKEKNHEVVAKGLEKYILEGVAPSEELKPIFQRLKGWIIDAYKAIRGIVLPHLTDDVRAVYDRMLAAPEEIEAAHANMERASWLAKTDNPDYAKALQAAHEAALSKLAAKWNEDIVRRQTKEWKDAYASEREAIKQEMLGDPARDKAYKSIMALTGKDFDGNVLKDDAGNPVPPVQISESALDRVVGPEAKKLLPKGSTTRDLGADPDAFAESMGYKSIKDLLDDLHDTKPFEKELDQRAKDAADFIAAHDEKSTVAEKALDAAHNEEAAKVIRMEGKELLKQNPEVALKMLREELTKEFAGKMADEKEKAFLDKMQAAIEKGNLEVSARWFQAGLRKMGSLLMSNADIKAKAGDEVMGKTIRDLDPNLYAAAERRARKESGEAFAKGDVEAAMAAKGQELFAHECYRAAQDAKKDIQKGIDYSKRFDKAATQKRLGSDFLDQINTIRELVGIRRNESRKAKQTESLLDWARGLKAAGHEPAISDWLAQLQTPLNYKDVKASDFLGAVDAMKSLSHIAADLKSLNTSKGKISLEDGVEQLQGVLGEKIDPDKVSEKNAELYQPAARLAVKGEFWPWVTRGITSLLRRADADLLTPDFQKEIFDRGLVEGPFGRLIFDRILDGNYRKKDMLKDLSDKFQAKGEELGADWQKSLNDVVPNDKLLQEFPDGTKAPRKFTRWELLGMALHSGNESNWSKLTKGWGWDSADAMKFLHDNMTAKDWDATEAVWESFGPQFEASDAMIRRLGGVSPPQIKPRPFDVTLPDGTVRTIKGGYAPVRYDTQVSKQANKSGVPEASATEAVGKGLVYNATTTRNGSMIERKEGYTDKVSLDPNVCMSAMRDTIHDLSYREALMDVTKILNHPGFRDSFKKAYGPEYLRGIETMVGNIRDQFSLDPANLGFQRAMNYSRQGVLMVGAAYRVSTLLKHEASSQLKSLGFMGNGDGVSYYAARAARMGTGHMQEEIAGAKEKFGEIRARLTQIDRDFQGTVGNMYTAQSMQDKIQEYGHFSYAWADTMVAVPTAWAAYDLAINKGVPESMGGTGKPMSDEDAVHYANRIVREAHGTATEAARSNFLNTSDPLKKQLGTFYGFMNTTYGQQRQMLDALVNGGHFTSKPALAARFMSTLIAPSLAVGLIAGKDEAESWWKWAAKSVAGEVADTVPLVRDAWKTFEGLAMTARGNYGNAPSIPALQSVEAPAKAAADVVRIGQAMKEGKSIPHTQVAQDVADTVGIWGHIAGAGMAGHVAQYALNVAQGHGGGGTPAHEVKKALVGGQ